jgi:hypothetical protein
MTKESFIELIGKLKSNSDTIHQAYKLKIDLVEFTDPWENIITTLLEEVFTKDGCDTIEWWVYEDGRNAWYADKTPIPLDTEEDLYNFLVEEGYVKEKEEQIEKIFDYISERKKFYSNAQQHANDISFHLGAESELLEIETFIIKKILKK